MKLRSALSPLFLLGALVLSGSFEAHGTESRCEAAARPSKPTLKKRLVSAAVGTAIAIGAGIGIDAGADQLHAVRQESSALSQIENWKKVVHNQGALHDLDARLRTGEISELDAAKVAVDFSEQLQSLTDRWKSWADSGTPASEGWKTDPQAQAFFQQWGVWPEIYAPTSAQTSAIQEINFVLFSEYVLIGKIESVRNGQLVLAADFSPTPTQLAQLEQIKVDPFAVALSMAVEQKNLPMDRFRYYLQRGVSFAEADTWARSTAYGPYTPQHMAALIDKNRTKLGAEIRAELGR